MSKDYTSLRALIRSNSNDLDEPKIKRAYNFAFHAHKGQVRKSGDPFISHPLEVAIILTQWKLDESSIIAGLLHDTVEDTKTTLLIIEKEFGVEVRDLVDGVTKVDEFELTKHHTKTIENFRKLLLVMARDLRVVLIKLADRLHNMRTLEYLSEQKQKAIAEETLLIFAPLAERLGMGEVKGELEDLSFKYLHSSKYQNLITKTRSEYNKAERHIKKMHNVILSELAAQGIDAELHGRKKHLYSLWKKLQRPGIDGDITKITDIVALRILVDTKEECYVALGIVHQHYKPIPNLGISDFIAQPKPNGYQSIHTKVFGPKNRSVEVQIRTFDMHREAEFGASAHWNISELKSSGKLSSEDIDKGVSSVASKLKWVQELLKWQQEIKDTGQFEDAVKFDALSHRQFVFSPKGDIYDLPIGATPIDFAVAVHSDLINYIKFVKVNNSIVPLNSELKSGDVVHIEKTKVRKLPNEDWVRSVRTVEAKRALSRSLGREH